MMSAVNTASGGPLHPATIATIRNRVIIEVKSFICLKSYLRYWLLFNINTSQKDKDTTYTLNIKTHCVH
jgi:hypothetical protein